MEGPMALGEIDLQESYNSGKASIRTSLTEKLSHVKMAKEKSVVYVTTRITKKTSLH